MMSDESYLMLNLVASINRMRLDVVNVNEGAFQFFANALGVIGLY